MDTRLLATLDNATSSTLQFPKQYPALDSNALANMNLVYMPVPSNMFDVLSLDVLNNPTTNNSNPASAPNALGLVPFNSNNTVLNTNNTSNASIGNSDATTTTATTTTSVNGNNLTDSLGYFWDQTFFSLEDLSPNCLIEESMYAAPGSINLMPFAFSTNDQVVPSQHQQLHQVQPQSSQSQQQQQTPQLVPTSSAPAIQSLPLTFSMPLLQPMVWPSHQRQQLQPMFMSRQPSRQNTRPHTPEKIDIPSMQELSLTQQLEQEPVSTTLTKTRRQYKKRTIDIATTAALAESEKVELVKRDSKMSTASDEQDYDNDQNVPAFAMDSDLEDYEHDHDDEDDCHVTTKRKRSQRDQVKVACVHCKKACKKCDESRPCNRCAKYNLDCSDAPRKIRKKRAPNAKTILKMATKLLPSSRSDRTGHYHFFTEPVRGGSRESSVCLDCDENSGSCSGMCSGHFGHVNTPVPGSPIPGFYSSTKLVQDLELLSLIVQNLSASH